MKKILLLGRTGQVGWEMHRAFSNLGEVNALDFPEVDYTNPALLRELVLDYKPDIILNAVAYTAVDQAEREPAKVMQINAEAPGLLAELAGKLRAVLVHISTDFVFDGTKSTPYTEDDVPNPLSVYARSKLAGDQAVQSMGKAYFILRSSWIYSLRRDNFVKKVLHWAQTQPKLRVVTDQMSNPTWARPLAEATAQMLVQGRDHLPDWGVEHCGIYNVANTGCASRFEWASEILRLDASRASRTVTSAVYPALSADFPMPAERPLYTALDCSRFTKTFGLTLPDWRTSLRLCMDPE